MTCFQCHGPTHPATSWMFRTDVVYCGVCARPFAEWYHVRMNAQSREDRDFNIEAATSIVPNADGTALRELCIRANRIRSWNRFRDRVSFWLKGLWIKKVLLAVTTGSVRGI